jgi:hypothetical protein
MAFSASAIATSPPRSAKPTAPAATPYTIEAAREKGARRVFKALEKKR